MALMIVGVSDFGLFLQSYFRATHVAREGLRTAVAIPRLESSVLGVPTTFTGNYLITNTATPIVSQSPGMTSNHAQLHERIRRLLQVENNGTNRSMQLQNDEIQIQSRCIQGGDDVEVSLAATYAPLLPLQNFFGTGAGFRYRVTVTGTYLFNGCV